MPASPSSEATASAPGVWTVLPRGAGDADRDLLGGKGAGLCVLAGEGFSVPRFFCLTTRAWDELLAPLPAPLRDELERPGRDPAAVAALGRRARAALAATGLPAAALAELEAGYDAVLAGSAVSVRSSAVGEDAAAHSFAGQFDSYLNVGREQLGARVLDCLCSAFSDRALLYRGVNGLGLAAARMAVVVQELVDSVAAGVAFTADPVSGRRDRVTITANLGLGISVVDGTAATDLWRVGADGTIAERQIAAKGVAVRPVGGGEGTVRTELGEEAALPALSDDQVRELASLARQLAARRGEQQDVEWALAPDGGVRLLQARPLTTPPAGRPTVFDNSNLVESYPGLTTPLTFSVMRRAYRDNFRGLVHAFGARGERVERNADVYDNLVGILAGRMYYDLSSWYRMFLQLPGMERALPAFEKAMGFRPDAASSPPRSLRDRVSWLPLQALVAVRLVAIWFSLPRRTRSYREAVERWRRELDATGVERLCAHELQDWLDRCTRELFWKMSAAPLSDFFTQQLYGALGALIGRWELGEPDALRNELLCGEAGMESVEPVHSLVSLSERIGADPAARTLFESDAPAAAVWARLQEDSRFAMLADALALHVSSYGDRSLEELKLETTTLADEPTGLIPILRNYLRGGKSVAAMESHERAIRDAAERRVREGLRRRPLRRLLFAAILRRCRGGLKARESIRLTRGRMAGLLRRLYRALGERFAAAGVLDRDDDVFFLTDAELADAVRGASVTNDLRRLVELRRGEYERAGEAQLPARIETAGIVAAAEPRAVTVAVSGDGACLTGTGCSPGRVSARAKIVTEPSPELALDGEILVAQTTDPGWVFLMVAASGLVSEQGNMLSHTAIIGRELGVPTVVGVEAATRLIEDGATVELDGRAGTVVQRRGGAA